MTDIDQERAVLVAVAAAGADHMAATAELARCQQRRLAAWATAIRAGLSYEQVARVAGVERSTVHRGLSRAGIDARPERETEDV